MSTIFIKNVKKGGKKEEAYSISGEDIYRNSNPGDRKRGSCPNLFN